MIYTWVMRYASVALKSPRSSSLPRPTRRTDALVCLSPLETTETLLGVHPSSKPLKALWPNHVIMARVTKKGVTTRVAQ